MYFKKKLKQNDVHYRSFPLLKLLMKWCIWLDNARTTSHTHRFIYKWHSLVNSFWSLSKIYITHTGTRINHHFTTRIKMILIKTIHFYTSKLIKRNAHWHSQCKSRNARLFESSKGKIILAIHDLHNHHLSRLRRLHGSFWSAFIYTCISTSFKIVLYASWARNRCFNNIYKRPMDSKTAVR